MDTMENINARSLMINTGIILEYGAICQDKINLISGALTAPLIEMVWISSGYDTKVMERISIIFTHLFNKSQEGEMLAVLRILYDLSGLNFPEEVEMLAGHSEARQCFLFSFLLDMEDCMQDFKGM